MFTGIIEASGTVRSRSVGGLSLRSQPRLKGVVVGESIAVDGVCLTVDRVNGEEMAFRLLPETLRTTTLGFLKAGGRVTLERSLQAGRRVGGHLLLGHVDGRGKILSRQRVRDTVTLGISLPAALASLLVPKGPIAVDGVSLTVDLPVPGTRKVPGTDVRFSVHLIRHTLSATALDEKRQGEEVNLEMDLVAKYLRGML